MFDDIETAIAPPGHDVFAGTLVKRSVALAKLKEIFGVKHDLGVFLRVYVVYHSDSAACLQCARNVIRGDYLEYSKGGPLVYKVLWCFMNQDKIRDDHIKGLRRKRNRRDP